MDDVEIMGGYKISNEQIEGLEKCDDAGEGSEVSITKKSMMAQVWMSVKSLPRCNKVKNRLMKSVRQVIIMEVKPIMI